MALMINTSFSRAIFKLNQQEITHYKEILDQAKKKTATKKKAAGFGLILFLEDATRQAGTSPSQCKQEALQRMLRNAGMLGIERICIHALISLLSCTVLQKICKWVE